MGTPKQGSSKKLKRSARNKAKKKTGTMYGEVQTAQPQKTGSAKTSDHPPKTR